MEKKCVDVTNEVYRHTRYGKCTEVKLSFVDYMSNGTLSLYLMSKSPYDSGRVEQDPFNHPYARVTANLPESSDLAVNEQFIDSNNLPGIGRWLQDNGIAEPAGVTARSGYCVYEAYAFNISDNLTDQFVMSREDCLAQNIVRMIENSGLVPCERNINGDFYRLNSVEGKRITVVVSKESSRTAKWKRRGFYILDEGGGDERQLTPFRYLFREDRRDVYEALVRTLSDRTRLRR